MHLEVFYQPVIPPDGDPIADYGDNYPLERPIVFKPVYSSGNKQKALQNKYPVGQQILPLIKYPLTIIIPLEYNWQLTNVKIILKV